MRFLFILLLAGCGSTTPTDALDAKLQSMSKGELLNYAFTSEEAKLLRVPAGIPISALIGHNKPAGFTQETIIITLKAKRK